MIISKKILYFCLLSLFIYNHFLFAQPQPYTADDDIDSFLRAGKACYKKGMLNEATLEFENVLIIDRTNFQARVWLAQIYIDKKDITNARKLLMEASMQAPDHPRVKELQKLIGMSGDSVKQDLIDPVIAETVVGIASATKHRKYGLVIPEDKIIEENLEKKLLVSSDRVFNERKEILQKLDNSKNEIASNIDKHFTDKSDNPLAQVFQIYKYQGLNAALDKYFELVLRDPTLASKDDNGLLDDGDRIFSNRFAQNPDDLEARYYCGVLQYINGMYEESDVTLSPFRKNPGVYASKIQPYLAGLNKWREQERIRMASLKLEEEQRIEREAKEREKAEAEKNDVWAKVKSKGASNKNSKDKNSDLASAQGKTEAAKIHTEGYNLYKKGKLDEAIAKYEEAIAKDGENPEFNYHLGLGWTDKGLAGEISAYDNAITSYQKVISLAPNSNLAKEAAAMINDIQQTKYSLGEK